MNYDDSPIAMVAFGLLVFASIVFIPALLHTQQHDNSKKRTNYNIPEIVLITSGILCLVASLIIGFMRLGNDDIDGLSFFLYLAGGITTWALLTSLGNISKYLRDISQNR